MTNISSLCGGADTGRSLVAGTLRGYRTWSPMRSRDLPAGMLPLRSAQIPQVIWTASLHARCLTAELHGRGDSAPPVTHQAPGRACRCGIYGWYQPRDRRMVPAPVFGVIAASGVIVMGSHGFRAQHARIVAIVTRQRDLTAACEDAGIAVYRRRRHLLHDHPTEDLTALLDDHAHH